MSTPIRTLIGKNEDGSDRYQYAWDPHQFLGVVFLTGPIAGTVVLHDGTSYDVTDLVIDVRPEHHGPLTCRIHQMHNANGTPGFPPHVHSDFCGAEAEPTKRTRPSRFGPQGH